MIAISVPRVAQDVLPEVLYKEHGVQWNQAGHVTATGSLARAIQGGAEDQPETRGLALPLATLIDLVTFGDLPGRLRLDESAFPGPGVFEDSVLRRQKATGYGRQVNEWRQVAAGRRLRIDLDLESSLRGFLLEGSYDPTARALMAGRRRLIATLHSLVSAGVRPTDIAPDDPVAALATRAWARMEEDVPALAHPRELLWAELDDPSRWSSVKVRLTDRLQAAFGKAFGENNSQTLVHHGFYFYTPVQWIVFQALKGLTGIKQVFIVHDDGENPAFSSWRYFFREELAMPVPQPVPGRGGESTPAKYFRQCLQGGSSASFHGIDLVDFRSPVQLVRTLREDLSGDAETEVYAAAHGDVRRFASRLGFPDTDPTGNDQKPGREVPATRLAQLPVGVFLLGLHRCIGTDSAGAPIVQITQDAFADVVGSGCLPKTAHDRPTLRTIQQVLPYFRGCSAPSDWRDRSDQLLAAIESYVSLRGLRVADQDDTTRIAIAAGNPARLAPWADLTIEQACAVREATHELARLLEEIAARERVVLGDYLTRLHAHLLRGLTDLPPHDAELIHTRLRGVGVLADQEVDVVGLVDIVSMVLGRTVEFDDASQDDEVELDRRTIAPLRSLDGLGYRRSRSGVHLANMAEDSFPTRVQAVGWPYALKDLGGPSGAGVDPVCRDLIAAREQTAALGDLYLFWLALDGVDQGAAITVSWVSGSPRERRRLSPIANLLAVPAASEAVRQMAGGIPIRTYQTDANNPADRELPTPPDTSVDELGVRRAIEKVDARAVASAAACPRRFAIQWALGPSSSFSPLHLQNMLYGNLRELQSRDLKSGSLSGMNPLLVAMQLQNLFSFMTPGQRASSENRAGIHHRGLGGVGSAKPEWIFTLKGNATGESPLDRAYQLGRSGQHPGVESVAPPSSVRAFLPEGTEDADTCSWCPVQAHCLHWASR